AQHPVLRSAIHRTTLGTAYQVVHSQVDEGIDFRDWRAVSGVDQQKQLGAYLDSDRRRGFAPSRPPLSRVALFQLGEGLHQLVWSIHHVVVDGWCLSVLLHEFLDNYEALRRGREPESKPARAFRDYVAWLRGRDQAEAEAYWRKALRGFVEPTPLGLDGLIT